MADSNLRLLLILQKIPRFPRSISTQQIREQLLDDGYEVTLRTIQRDLSSLSAKFPLQQTDPTGRGKTGVAWCFMLNSPQHAFPLMDTTAALTLLMGIEHLQQVLPPQILEYLQPLKAEAQQSLQNLHKGPYGQWLDKVRVLPQQILLPPAIEQTALEAIYRALLEGRQFVASYFNKSEQIIHPYGLVQRGNTFYLLCRFFHYPDVRITALHRYSHVELLDKAVTDFPEFNIDSYLNTGAMQWPIKDHTPIELQLRINQWLYGHLIEAKLAATQTIQEDKSKAGWYVLTAPVIDSHDLRWWLLSRGDALEVLEPKALREWFTALTHRQYQHYQES